jgi:hypothetical protein
MHGSTSLLHTATENVLARDRASAPEHALVEIHGKYVSKVFAYEQPFLTGK